MERIQTNDKITANFTPPLSTVLIWNGGDSDSQIADVQFRASLFETSKEFTFPGDGQCLRLQHLVKKNSRISQCCMRHTVLVVQSQVKLQYSSPLSKELRFRYGMGPVPSDYFVDPKTAMSDYDQLTTVYAGDKHLISIRIKEKSRIW